MKLARSSTSAPKSPTYRSAHLGNWQGMNWIRQEKRLAIYIRDAFTCQYCGTDLRNAQPGTVSLDHLTPRSLGGSNHQSNLVTVCSPCNSARGNRSWENFAPAGAQMRIIAQTAIPLNIPLAKSILNGTAHDPRTEALR